jgi:putative transposase
LWIVIEQKIRQTLEYISQTKKEYMLIAEQFIQSLVRKYGKHPVSTDGVWYMVSANLQIIETKIHYIHLPYGKSIIERTIQYVKHRTESFDDYFPCRNERRICKLEYILN